MNKKKIIKHLKKRTKKTLKRTKRKTKIPQSTQNKDIILNGELMKYLSTTNHLSEKTKLSHVALKNHLLSLKNKIQTIICNYHNFNNNTPQKKTKKKATIHTIKDKNTIPIRLTFNKDTLDFMSIFDLILQAKLRKIIIFKTTNIPMLRKQLLARITLFDKALNTIHFLTTPIYTKPKKTKKDLSPPTSN